MSDPSDQTLVNLGDAGKLRQSNVKQIVQAVAGTVGVLGLGGTGVVEGLDYTLISDSQISSYEAHIASLDQRVEEVRSDAVRQVEQCLAGQAALRGQNCEHLRAAGALREDADCWGMER